MRYTPDTDKKDGQLPVMSPETAINMNLRILNGLKELNQLVRIRGIYCAPTNRQTYAWAGFKGVENSVQIRLYFSERENNMHIFNQLVPQQEYVLTGYISVYSGKEALCFQLTPVEINVDTLEPKFYPLSEELFKAYVKRDTVVTIEDAGEGEYTIRYTMRYSVDASAAALNLDTEFIPQPQDYEMSSGSRYTAEDLKYLYIFYEPFSVGMDTESLVLNAVAISTEDAWSCRLYLAVQEGKATGDLSFQVLMDAGLTADECEARLQILSAGGLKNLGMNYTMDLVPLRPAEDKVYRVTVRIMETDTGEVVAQADTTVYYE